MSRISTGIDFQDAVVNLRLTSSACYDLAYDIFYALERSCEKHCVNHPDVWRDHEKIRIARMQQFFALAGYEHIFEGMVDRLQYIVTPKPNHDMTEDKEIEPLQFHESMIGSSNDTMDRKPYLKKWAKRLIATEMGFGEGSGGYEKAINAISKAFKFGQLSSQQTVNK